MVDYICKRCGYYTKNKSYLVKHLNNKKICIAKNEDVERDALLEELNSNNSAEKIYKCNYCDNTFGYLSNKYRHHRTCDKKPKSDTIVLSRSALDDLINKGVEEKLSRQGNAIHTQNIGVQNANTINNNQNNITNNNIHNYYDINKPNYSENLFTLDEQIKLIKEAADDPVTFGMSAYHREKYFNENRKELQCIKLTPDLLQKNKIGIYNGQYWEEKNLHELLPKITDEAGKFVGVILYDSKTAFQIDRAKNVEMRGRVDNMVLNQTPEEESNQILDKMTDDFVKYTEKIHK